MWTVTDADGPSGHLPMGGVGSGETAALEEKMRVEVEIPDEDGEALGQLLRSNGSDDEKTAATVTIVELAAGEWISWILHGGQHRTLSELHIERTATIYSTVLAGQRPTRQVLYNSFSMPYGQAGYIARVLSERSQGAWQQSARADLDEAIRAQVAEAKELVATGLGETEQRLRLTEFSWRELEYRFTAALAEDDLLEPPSIEKRIGDHRYVRLHAATLAALDPDS